MINDPVILQNRECKVHHGHCMCWSAIFSGALVGVGLAFLLHMYGVAIGLSAYSSSPDGASTIAIGGVLGMLIGVIAAMATAGFVAGYLGHHHYHHTHGGVIYGFITWSLVLILSVLIAGPLMQYADNYNDALSKPVSVQSQNAGDEKAGETTITAPKVKVETATSVKEITPKELAWSGWIVFGLFFIGALSSCVGACCGMGCKRPEE